MNELERFTKYVSAVRMFNGKPRSGRIVTHTSIDRTDTELWYEDVVAAHDEIELLRSALNKAQMIMTKRVEDRLVELIAVPETADTALSVHLTAEESEAFRRAERSAALAPGTIGYWRRHAPTSEAAHARWSRDVDRTEKTRETFEGSK